MKLYIKNYFLLALMVGWGNMYAQKNGQVALDSMLQELPRAKEDTNKVKLLTSIISFYNPDNPDEGIKYGRQALDLATKLEWEKGVAAANVMLGLNCKNRADYPRALEYYSKALKIEEETGDKKNIAGVNGNIATVYMCQSDYPKALEYDSKALKMYEETGDKKGIAKICSNTGSVYDERSDYPKALEYYLKALKIDEEMGSKSSMAIITGNIGVLYVKQYDYNKALEYDFRSLKISEEIGDKIGIEITDGNIGNVYRALIDYPKALEYFFKSLKVSEEIGDKSGISIVTGNIGDVYSFQKKYRLAIAYEQAALRIDEEIGDKHNIAWQLKYLGSAYLALAADTAKEKLAGVSNASELPEEKYLPAGTREAIPAGKAARLHLSIDYLQRALALAKEINARDVMQESYQYLAEACKASGDYKQGMEYIASFYAVKDSVFSKENNDKVIKMGMQNEFDKKTALSQKSAALKLQRQQSYTYMGLAGFSLLLAFSFFIARNNKLLTKEKKRSEDLLLNILPAEVATELKDKGSAAARHFDHVTVLFTDFVNFTEASTHMSPQALINELHTCFKKFDEITGKYNVEKIKTIGDAYLAVAGLPTADAKHAENAVRAAIEINAFMQDRMAKLGNSTFDIRIGIHSGSVVAGIVGVKKFAYDIWGDTVNTAARMEQNSEAGKINISQTTYELVKDKFTCDYRGEIDAKGKGMLKMYFVG